jgi:hypothetical protein
MTRSSAIISMSLAIFSAGVAPAVASSTALQSAPVTSPDSPHLITGTLTAIDRSTLTLKTRTGKSVKIDDAQAIRDERVGTPLNVGIPLTVQGSLIEGTGALQATAITRAKGTGELWPSDR